MARKNPYGLKGTNRDDLLVAPSLSADLLAFLAPFAEGGLGLAQLRSILSLASGESAGAMAAGAGEAVQGYTLDGRGGNDTVIGGAGADILLGGSGGDKLAGGSGADRLTGGTGRDVFIFTSIADSSPEAPDLITDFARLGQVGGSGRAGFNSPWLFVSENGFDPVSGEERPHWSPFAGDIVDLSAIDADTGTEGDQAFSLVTGGFTGKAGEAYLVYDADAKLTHLFLDVDGDAVVDMTINFAGDLSLLTADSFIL